MRTETVLVTGASSGIGLELARCFARDGSRLLLVARKRAVLQSLAQELHSAHKTACEVLQWDLSQADAAARICYYLETHGTRIDVLVNNAGVGANGFFAELSLERQMEMLRINIMALTELTRRLLPRMIERKQGGVLNVASCAAFQPGPRMAVYYASKAYVLWLTEALAEETKGTGVTLSALCPGPTVTNFAAASGATHSRLFDKTAMSAEAVARMGFEGFRAGRVIVIPGTRNRLMSFGVRLGPRSLVRKIAGSFNKASYATTSEK